MSTETDISALYREFTYALTEVLAEMLLVWHDAAGLRGHALPRRRLPLPGRDRGRAGAANGHATEDTPFGRIEDGARVQRRECFDHTCS